MSQTTVYDTDLIGYAPVSKADGSQSLDLQRDALWAANMNCRESVQRSRRTSAR